MNGDQNSSSDNYTNNKVQQSDRISINKSYHQSTSIMNVSEYNEDKIEVMNDVSFKNEPKRKSILKNRNDSSKSNNRSGMNSSLFESPLVNHYKAVITNKKGANLKLKKESPVKINSTFYKTENHENIPDKKEEISNNDKNNANKYDLTTPYIKLPPIHINITHKTNKNNYTIINNSKSNDPNLINSDKSSSETETEYRKAMINRYDSSKINNEEMEKKHKKVEFIIESKIRMNTQSNTSSNSPMIIKSVIKFLNF